MLLGNLERLGYIIPPVGLTNREEIRTLLVSASRRLGVTDDPVANSSNAVALGGTERDTVLGLVTLFVDVDLSDNLVFRKVVQEPLLDVEVVLFSNLDDTNRLAGGLVGVLAVLNRHNYFPSLKMGLGE